MTFGPYWRLSPGPYALTLAARCEAGPDPRHPVLGLEVILQDRFQRLWRDFTAAELDSHPTVLFEVGAAFEGADAPIEFKLFNLGWGRVAIERLELARSVAAPEPQPPVWRLAGRVGPRSLADRLRSVSRRGRGFRLGLRPRLRLPEGAYELRLAVKPSRTARAAAEVRVEAVGRALLAQAAIPSGPARQSFALPFFVDRAVGLEGGAAVPIDVQLRGAGVLKRIDSLDLALARSAALRPAAPAQIGQATRRLLVIGNCQAETIAQAVNRAGLDGAPVEARYHAAKLALNLADAGRSELERADLVLVQDIGDLEHYPLTEALRAHPAVQRFPLLRFASLWPFDGYNGRTDRLAHDREAPEFAFVCLDGLLGRLREEIPDPEARFRAYRALAVPNIVDPVRLHGFEARRLAKMDADYGIAIGAFILDRFRREPLFHTIAHPGGRLFRMLIGAILAPHGLDLRLANRDLDHLGRDQVPIHPAVARALGVRWAKERRRYTHRGQRLTWEQYVRSYIRHYG